MPQHQVTVMGRQVKIRSESDQDHIEAVARYLNEKIDGIMQGQTAAPSQQVLLLAALNIADEVFSARADHDALREKIRHHSRSLLERLGHRA